ncbi:MAG: oxygen-independent coproporphyrinogen III oxidase [Bacteroidia bacterium]
MAWHHSKELIRKYNIPGPRYTSYPTVPFWDEGNFVYEQWINSIQKNVTNNKDKGISIYIHLPFCENLCTFCGCHKRITKRHEVEEPYINTLLHEWQIYSTLFEEKPVISEIHLGGGTPTFFSPKNLEHLMNGLLKHSIVKKEFEFGFEGHPLNTTKEHLQSLYNLGFKRASFGVQDYNEKVQKAINRIQPFESVKRVTEQAREIGYDSISHDLVFGLPHQTVDGVKKNIELTNELKPDRISYYSYAHVPWIKGLGQRGFNDEDIPKDEVKRSLYEIGKEQFLENGYFEIGMDHFALSNDSLYKAFELKKLHRNFMGYTTTNTKLMIGLGMSAISDSWTSFAQNNKTVEEYTAIVNKGKLPVFRGHHLNEEDVIIRQHILNIMCHFETSWNNVEQQFDGLETTLHLLKEMEDDKLITINNSELKVTELGKPFVRNICMAFDQRLLRNKPTTQVFSMTI